MPAAPAVWHFVIHRPIRLRCQSPSPRPKLPLQLLVVIPLNGIDEAVHNMLEGLVYGLVADGDVVPERVRIALLEPVQGRVGLLDLIGFIQVIETVQARDGLAGNGCGGAGIRVGAEVTEISDTVLHVLGDDAGRAKTPIEGDFNLSGHCP